MTNTNRHVINVEFNKAEDNTGFFNFLDPYESECRMTDSTGKTVVGIGHTKQEASEHARKQLGLDS